MASTLNDGLSFNCATFRTPAELQWLTGLRRPVASPHRTAFTTGPALSETLEPRRLLAGIEAGILVARGTDGGDVISLRRTGPDDVIVTTNGHEQTFDMDDFTGVRLEGLGGDDRISVVDPLINPVNPSVTLDGGAGRDTLSTSTGSETILGGDGLDTVDYTARTESLNFSFRPETVGDRQDAAPYQMTSGAEADVFGFDLEVYIGGRAADRFVYGGRFPDERLTEEMLFNGYLGNDTFVDLSEFDVRYGVEGGDGDDRIFVDESRVGDIAGGPGNDTIEFEDVSPAPNQFFPGPGVDTVNFSFHSVDSGGFDMRVYPDLENVNLYTDFEQPFTITGNDLPNRIDAGRDTWEAITLRGLGGDDTLIGGSGADLLEGGAGADSLVGNDGNDTLMGGEGFDVGDGGPGINTYIGVDRFPAAPSIRIDGRTLIADGSWGTDRLTIQREGPDRVTVRVNETSATFATAEFDGVLLRGNKGFDEIRMLDEVPGVTLVGGRGNDTLRGSDGRETFLGGDADDSILAYGGNDSLVGAFGHDTLDAGTGTDTVDGGPGNDEITNAEITPPPPSIGIVNRVLIADGSWGVDLLTIEPVAGDDDVIIRVTDTVRRFDTDKFDGVLLRGQQGFDYLQVLQPITGLKVTLEGGNGYDTLLGSAGEEVLRGGTGNDVLRGFGGNDALFGNGGIDMLDAGDGDDFLDGADGRPLDRLLGRSGTDTALFDSGDEVSGVETFA